MDAETVVANLNEPVFALDADRTITFVNDRFLEVYQCAESSAVGSDYTFFGKFVREGFEAFSEAIEQILHTETTTIRVELQIRHPPSAPVPEQLWAEARMKNFTVTEDDGVLVSLRDITTRKEREETLRDREQEIERANQQLRQIIDLVPDPLFVKTLDDEVLLSNEANAELHGLTPDEIEGIREYDIEPDVENIEDFDKYRERERAVIETGEPKTFEEELAGPDGETRVFKMTRIPFQTQRTAEDAVLGYARDVTDLKEYEQELEETKRTLEQSNQKLDQFASVVSHDLRNPLNAAQLQLDLFRRENDDEHIDNAEQNLDRMESMIADLLTLSRAGETVEEPQQVSLAAVVTDSWETAKTGDADLVVEVAESTTVLADRDRLQHVFENLFRNAVDHNDHPLTVRVGLLDTPEDTQRGGFFVADTGDGIPADEREAVFEHGYTTSDDGTGIGLSIVDDIVDAHGWSITIVESHEGGTRFEVTGVDLREESTESWY